VELGGKQNPQRGRANNSAVLMRHKINKDYFMDLWKRIEASGAGEPGIYLSNDKDWGTNPCCEIALDHSNSVTLQK
jgi:ribonucleoside-triphosphate reductase (thioredoxin)